MEITIGNWLVPQKFADFITPLSPNHRLHFESYWENSEPDYRFENSWHFVVQYIEKSPHLFFDGMSIFALGVDHIHSDSLTLIHPMGTNVHIVAATIAREVMNTSDYASINIRYLNEEEYSRFISVGFRPRGDKYPQQICDIREISSLNGAKWSKIRLRLNRFTKHHSYECLDINDTSLQSALDACRTWQASYVKRYGPASSRPPIISNFNWLLTLISSGKIPEPTYSFVVIVEGIPSAVCVAAPVSRQSAAVYVNICDTSLAGLAEHIIYELAKRLLKDNYLYLNLGHSDLIQTHYFKKKFNPIYVYSTFSAIFDTRF